MAKAKFDFKSIEVPALAQKPLYAGVGAGDLAVTAVLEYVSDVQKKITGFQKDAQKTVADLDAKSVRSAAKARRTAIEARVAELQAEALSLPTKVQTVVNDNVATVAGTYGDLAKRGEAVVRGTKLPSTATVEVKVNTTVPKAKKAPVRKPAVTKAATAAKTTVTKKATAAKKSAPAKSTATKTAPAKKTATATKSTSKPTTTVAAKA